MHEAPIMLTLLTSLALLAPGRPAAVQLCLELPAGVSLYAAAPAPGYRKLGEAAMLDVELTVDGEAPERITRASGSCLRAYLPARRLTRIEVSFARTPFNLLPVSHEVDLSLKPDLWFDGGSVTVSRGAYGSVRTGLPGTLTLTRLRPLPEETVADLGGLPAGVYRLDYQPPRAPCEVSLAVKGVGTIRADRRPELFRELVDAYRSTFLPEVLERTRSGLCLEEEVLRVATTVVDGVFHQPYQPTVGTARRAPPPRYQLRRDGKTVPYTPGDELVLSFGEHVALELAREVVSASAR